jgi:hypothetical protein
MQTIWAAVGSRWEMGLRRSWWDARDAIGQQMWRYVIPGSLLAALLSIVALSLKWNRSAAGTLLAALLVFPLVFAFTFAGRLISNLRHPHQHEFWSVEPGLVAPSQGIPYLALSIRPKYLMTEGHYHCFCSVITPDGNQYRTKGGAPSVEYPRDFEDASALVAGVYRVHWLDETEDGKQKPLLAYKREVTEAMLEPGAVHSFE